MAVQFKELDNKNTLIFSLTSPLLKLQEEQLLSILRDKKITSLYAETDDKNISSLLAAEILYWIKLLKNNGISLVLDNLNSDLQKIMRLASRTGQIPPKKDKTEQDFLTKIGIIGFDWFQNIKDINAFVFQTILSLGRFITNKAIFRPRDFWFIFADCSYKAIGIVSLISFLVGLILAFVGSLQLQNFGAEIYVASMVALGMTRIMAAIMVGIIMAGRTGSSYAATLGTMKVNEEIDALKTLGIKVEDYLVSPRLVALVLTIPFLTLLADVLGIIGGAVVGVGFLDISTTTYLDYSIKALSLKNILIGLLHSFIYGIIIALCGCYEGLKTSRDADSVGKSTTNAVVTALVWMIVATGILTVILELFQI